jgi:hypothetical protein
MKTAKSCEYLSSKIAHRIKIFVVVYAQAFPIYLKVKLLQRLGKLGDKMK